MNQLIVSIYVLLTIMIPSAVTEFASEQSVFYACFCKGCDTINACTTLTILFDSNTAILDYQEQGSVMGTLLCVDCVTKELIYNFTGHTKETHFKVIQGHLRNGIITELPETDPNFVYYDSTKNCSLTKTYIRQNRQKMKLPYKNVCD